MSNSTVCLPVCIDLSLKIQILSTQRQSITLKQHNLVEWSKTDKAALKMCTWSHCCQPYFAGASVPMIKI